MCRETESQVWSTAESSPGYSEMQNGCDDKMKFQCFVIFMSCRLVEVMPHEENISPHSKTTWMSSNPIIKTSLLSIYPPWLVDFFHHLTAFRDHCIHEHVWKTRTLTASRRQHRRSLYTCQDLRGNLHTHRYYESPGTDFHKARMLVGHSSIDSWICFALNLFNRWTIK